MDAGVKRFEVSSADLQVYEQGIGSEVEQLALELEPIWDGGATGGELAYSTTVHLHSNIQC